MSLKMKLTSAIIMFMLILATLVIGVIAAESQTISMKGNVSFNINDRSLYLKSVRYKVGNDATEPVTLENFLPGYIDANMEVNIGDHEFNYSAFTLYFDIVNTTQNTYNAVEEVTLSPELSSQGVTASASGQISPTQETDSDSDGYAEIMPTSEPTGTITLSVTSTSTQAINLGDITITIEQAPINYTELGYTFSGNSITSLNGNVTDLVIPSSYKIDEDGNYIEDLDGTGTPITSIADYAFQDNLALTSITIPDTVISIGQYAFDGCINLLNVNLSETSQLQTIGDYAFSGCSSLTTITIPESVTSIGRGAFFDCTNLQSVDLNNCQITEIPNSAFSNCSSLNTITIPDGVTSIGESAFNGCTSLTTITIPEIVTSIGWYAFRDCSSLTTITIPETVTSIGDRAFDGCSSLQTVDFNNCQITEIPIYAFYNCRSLTTITIPETVTSIGNNAFYHCTSLQSVDFGTNSSLQTIGDEAFYYCTSLTTITIPEGVKSIGSGAFWSCYALAIVYDNSTTLTITAGDIGNGDVGYYAKEVVTDGQADGNITEENNIFYYNNGLTKSALGPKGEGSSITSVTLAQNTTEINQQAFVTCSSLQTVDFGTNSSLQTIGNMAFYYCSSLTTITIPDRVTSIESSAFMGCRSLTTVIIESSDIYKIATSTSGCGYLLRYAQTVKVLTRRVVEDGTNSYLTNTSNFPYTWTEGDYTVYSKTARS